MEDTICPIMSRPGEYSSGVCVGFVTCQKEKCMAWGKIITNSVTIPVNQDGTSNATYAMPVTEYGCKLIERGYHEKHP